MSAPAFRFEADPSARAASDAATLVERLARELTSLSVTVSDLQSGLGAVLEQAVALDPALMLQAQSLDLVVQSLHGLSTFLATVGGSRVGREPLDLEGAAATLSLSALGSRLAGQRPSVASDGLDLF